MTTINDLPNELLDEIFVYVNPFIDDKRIIPMNTVCRRWNRPFMTHELKKVRLPKDIDLQAKFPRLVSLTLYRNHAFDFKGHAYLKDLTLDGPTTLSAFNCPRLTHLYVAGMNINNLINPKALKACLMLCQSVTCLHLGLGENHERPDWNGTMRDIIQSRPRDYPGLRLKKLSTQGMPYRGFDLALFFKVFESPLMETIEFPPVFTSGEQVTAFFQCFPKVSKLELRDVAIVIYNQGHVFEHVKILETVHPCERRVSLSSILFQFPNIESLDEDWIDNWDVPVPDRYKWDI